MSAFVSRPNRGEVAAFVRDPKRSGTRAGVKMGSLMSAEKASGEVAGPKIPVYKKRYVANEPMHASIHLSSAEPVWIRLRLNFAPGRARFEACLSRAFFFAVLAGADSGGGGRLTAILRVTVKIVRSSRWPIRIESRSLHDQL